MNILKISVLLFFICIFKSTQVLSNTCDYRDKIVSNANGCVLLLSGLEFNNVLYFPISEIDEYEEDFVLIDYLKTIYRLKKMPKKKITSKNREIFRVARFFLSYQIPDVETYFQFLFVNNINRMELRHFFKTSIKVEKALHKISKKPRIKMNEMYNYLDYSNNVYYNYILYSYTVLKIKLYKSIDGTYNINHVRRIVKSINNNVCSEDMLNSDNFKGMNVNFKVFNLVFDKKKMIDHKLQKYMKLNFDRVFFGPIYDKNSIYFIKIIKRDDQTLRDVDVKVRHFYVRKKVLEREKFNLDIKKHNIHNFEKVIRHSSGSRHNNFLNKYSRIEFLNMFNTPTEFYNSIKNVRKYGFSKILETSDGWHLFKVLDREYSSKSKTYAVLRKRMKIYRKNLVRRYAPETVYSSLYKHGI